jgi:hypothetical protein
MNEHPYRPIELRNRTTSGLIRGTPPPKTHYCKPPGGYEPWWLIRFFLWLAKKPIRFGDYWRCASCGQAHKLGWFAGYNGHWYGWLLITIEEWKNAGGEE